MFISDIGRVIFNDENLMVNQQNHIQNFQWSVATGHILYFVVP